MSVKSRNILLYSMLAGFTLLGAGISVAAPVIDNVDGILRSGDILQLSGQDFGPGGTLISWDDFETGTPNQNLGVPIIGPTWTFQSYYPSTPYPYYSTDRALSGSQSAKVVWKEPGYNGYSINAFGWANQGPLNSLYISYWRYHDPSSDEIVGMNHKQLYMFGTANSSGFSDLQQFMPFMIPAGQSGWASMLQNYPAGTWYYGSFPYSSTLRRWNRWEAFVRYDSAVSANDGYFEVWVDAVLRNQRANLNLCDVTGGNAVNDIRIGHMFQGFGTMEYVRSFFDDVYISTSRARVELGNSATFANCTRREIQVPVSWADGAIVVRSHFTDSFQPGTTAYLFVVDEAGVPSTGRPVVVEGEPGGDTVSPVIDILTPGASGSTYTALTPVVSLSGTAADNVAVVFVAWENSLGSSGAALNTANWSAPEIPLFPGINRLTVSAFDAQGNSGVTYINVDYNIPGQPSQPLR